MVSPSSCQSADIRRLAEHINKKFGPSADLTAVQQATQNANAHVQSKRALPTTKLPDPNFPKRIKVKLPCPRDTAVKALTQLSEIKQPSAAALLASMLNKKFSSP